MNLPGDKDRSFIVGRTGSGKTHAACWQLSLRNYDVKPWIIYNFKTDELIDSIPGAQILDLEQPLPQQPGIYIVHPGPDEEEWIEAHMKSIWARRNIGVYVDEGYMVGKNNAGFRLLLTQGRSRRVPMIILSQRPVWMDRFVLSEADYIQVFHLTHKMDVAKMEEVVPGDLSERLPEYQSYYYEVKADQLSVMPKLPDIDIIMANFDRKLRRLKQVV